MTPGELAPFYPTLTGRIAELGRGIERAPRERLAVEMVRDMPASVLGAGGSGDPLWTGSYLTRHNRYVRRSAFPAFHASDGVTTAAAEVFGITPNRTPVLGLPGSSRLQLVVALEIPEVIDLSRGATLDEIGVSTEELIRVPDWSRLDAFGRPAAYELTQCIGELAFLCGAGGLLYPAARATLGVNAVVFIDNVARVGGSIRTTNPFTGREHSLP